MNDWYYLKSLDFKRRSCKNIPSYPILFLSAWTKLGRVGKKMFKENHSTLLRMVRFYE